MGRGTYRKWNASQILNDPMWRDAIAEVWRYDPKGHCKVPIGRITVKDGALWLKIRGGRASWTRYTTSDKLIEFLNTISGTEIRSLQKGS